MGIRFSATLFIATALGVWNSPAAAQSPLMRGSLSGYVFDPTAGGVRPLLGYPGSAIMGEPLPAGVDLQHAAVSPDGDYALAITTDGRGLIAILKLSGKTSVHPLGVETAAGDTVELSPSGTYAVLYQHATQSLHVVKGLPGAPMAGTRLNVVHLGDPLSAFAINDQGTVLAAAPAGDSSRIFVFENDGSSHLISTVHHAADLAFVNSTDAVLADDRHQEVYLLRSVTGVTATLPLAREAQGLSHPIAVAVSRDQKRVYVANAGSADIVAINLVDGVATRYSCPCSPNAVRRLNGTAVFRLTEPTDGPLWLFDGDQAQPRIVFVPASKAKQ